jgi:hypothetical protein
MGDEKNMEAQFAPLEGIGSLIALANGLAIPSAIVRVRTFIEEAFHHFKLSFILNQLVPQCREIKTVYPHQNHMFSRPKSYSGDNVCFSHQP